MINFDSVYYNIVKYFSKMNLIMKLLTKTRNEIYFMLKTFLIPYIFMNYCITLKGLLDQKEVEKMYGRSEQELETKFQDLRDHHFNN